MTTSELPTPDSANKRRVVIYCRISDDREGRRWGVDRQERDCRKRAAERGWDVVEVLVENDISAYSGRRRPKYQQLLDLLTTGAADAVLALTPKRLYRRISEAFAFLDLVERNDIAVETIKAGSFDLSTADGRREARRAAVDAQHESEEIGERVRDSKADNVTQGTFRGGPRPFGYLDGGMEVHEAEKRAVEAAMDALLAGDSLRSICRSWVEQGIRVPARRYRLEDGGRGEPVANEWTPVALRRMLLRGRNAGLMEVTVKAKDGTKRTEVAGPAAWPPLVSEEKWRAVKALLESPDRRTNLHNTARKRLGTGLYKCWCGESLVYALTGVGGKKFARENGQTYKPAYRCRTGRHATREMTAMDKYVQDMAIERLSRPDAVDLLLPPEDAGPDAEQLAAEANVLRAKLDGFTEDYGADLITRKQFLDGTARARERLAAVEASMAAVAQVPVLASLPLGTAEIAEQWEGYSLDRKRAIIDALMVVTAHPAQRGRPKGYKPGSGQPYFDRATISIEWKRHG